MALICKEKVDKDEYVKSLLLIINSTICKKITVNLEEIIKNDTLCFYISDF